MILRSIITILLFFSFTLSSRPQTSLPQKEVRAENGEKFLERFVGTWLGEGTSDGKKTRDEAKFEWLFGKRFLKINYRALEGDNYASEAYLWFNVEKGQYEFYEFNNGRWAVRQGTGKTSGNSLVIIEQRADVKLQLIFEFTGSDTIRMTEAYVREKGNEAFVIYTFRRKS